MADPSKLSVEVWSDIACPWCWVGKRKLEAAVAQFGDDVDVVWRSFELDPAAPKSLPDDVDLTSRLADKYGKSREGAEQMVDRMTAVGQDNGIEFRFDQARPGNTFDAHRLLHWAGREGKQNALKERLFEAYMQQGKLVSDHEVLVELAADVGLDPERAQLVLSSNDYASDVRRDEATAGTMGIHGVPFFVFGGRFALSGAQPVELLVQGLQKAKEDAAAVEIVGEESESCGPEGCAV